MSYDASSLRGCLQRIDGSAPTIQGAAKAMMKHYDKSPQVAVNCWRDMLVRGSTRSDQFLPLLYVANEVLQNSKRNRGNRFLEAFSPVLGQSLAYVCGKSPPPVVESIRRTVKIWAERRVFSIRYVNELLKGLEAYRNNGSGSGSGKGSSSGRDSSSGSGRKGDADAYPETSMGSPGGSRFSPGPESPQEQDNNDDDDDNLFGDGPSTAASNNNNNNNKTIDSMDESDNDHDHDNSDNDSIDDLFGNATTTTKRLQVDVDFDRAASLSSSLQQPNSSKRKRNSGGSGSGNNQRNSNSNNNNNNNNSNKNSNKHKHNNKPGKRRNSAKQYLSATSLLDLMQQVSGLGHEAVVSELGDLRRAYAHDSDNDNDNSDGNSNSKNNNSSSNNNKDIESLVGHELLAAYRTTLKEEAKLANCRKRLRSIAETKRGLELEAFRYLPWLERALKQDADDLELFGATYRNQLLAFARVHEPTKNARDRRLAAEALRLEREREKQNRKREEEERKKFMESAMSKQTEAQPGMVWNRATGEYQHLNQEESWRD